MLHIQKQDLAANLAAIRWHFWYCNVLYLFPMYNACLFVYRSTDPMTSRSRICKPHRFLLFEEPLTYLMSTSQLMRLARALIPPSQGQTKGMILFAAVKLY